MVCGCISVRYRCLMPLAYLRKHKNIHYDFVYPGYRFNEILNFLNVYFHILFRRKTGALIVIQKVHTNKIYGHLLIFLVRYTRTDTLYDIDDADYLKYNPAVIHYFLKNCTYCFAGSKTILDYISPFNKNNFLLTSPVKESAFLKTGKNDVLQIGWIGFYNAHRESLFENLFPALTGLEFPVRLYLLGVTTENHAAEIRQYFEAFRHVELEIPLHLNWQNDKSIQLQIAHFDIGVAPLNNTPINAAKSAFKMKQYLSCGVPVLASPVGENENFLTNGYNGFFCRDKQEFAFYIKKIREMNPEEYKEMSRNALSSTHAFNLENYCKLFLDNLESIAEKN